MIRNFDQIAKELNGEDAIDPVTKKVINMKDMVANAVAGFYQDEKLSFSDKEKRALLAKKVFAGGDAEYSIEDLALIKKLCGMSLSVMAVGQISEILEPTKVA